MMAFYCSLREDEEPQSMMIVIRCYITLRYVGIFYGGLAAYGW